MSYKTQLKKALANGWNWPPKKKDMDGKIAKTMKNYRNNAGETIPEGSVCRVSSSSVTVTLSLGKIWIRFVRTMPAIRIITQVEPKGENNANIRH